MSLKLSDKRECSRFTRTFKNNKALTRHVVTHNYLDAKIECDVSVQLGKMRLSNLTLKFFRVYSLGRCRKNVIDIGSRTRSIVSFPCKLQHGAYASVISGGYGIKFHENISPSLCTALIVMLLRPDFCWPISDVFTI